MFAELAMPRVSYLYVVSADDEDLIKIGIATNIKSRLTTLNTSRTTNPLSVRALFSGTRTECLDIEERISRDWSNIRVNGEFYDATIEEALEKVMSFDVLNVEDHEPNLAVVDLTDDDELAELIQDYKTVSARISDLNDAKREVAAVIREIVGEEPGKYRARTGTVSVSQSKEEVPTLIDEKWYGAHKGKELYGRLRFAPRRRSIRISIR